MADRLGRNIAVSVGVEDSYGAGQVTPKMYVLGRSTLKLDPVQTLIQTPEIRPDPNPAQPIRDIIDMTGSLALVTSADAMPLMLNLLLGNSATTSTAVPYVWTSKVLANALKSAVIERWDSVETKSDQVKGALLTSMSLSWKKSGGPLLTTWGFAGVGATPVRGAGTRLDAAPTVLSATRHSSRDCTLTVDGFTTAAPFITGFDLSFTFATQRRDGITGNIFADAMNPGACAITGTITASRPSTDLINGFCDGADHILVFTSPKPSDATRYVKITMSQVRLERSNPTDESAAGMVTEQFSINPYYTTHADGTAAVFAVANDKASY